MIKNLITLLLFFISISAFSQLDTGQVNFTLYPVIGDSYVKINDSLYNKLKARLPVGEYEITLWAPNYLPVDTSLTIYRDSVVYMRKVLSPNPEYITYRNELKDYKKKVTIPKIINYSTSSFLTIGTIGSYFNARNKWNNAIEAHNQYERSLGDVVLENKQIYEDKRDKYKRSRKTTFILGGASIVSWGVTYFLVKKLNKRAKPINHPAPPVFEISSIPATPSGHFSLGNETGLTLKYNF